MSSDINVQTFSGKVNINNNLLVGSSHFYVDTVGNKVGITTASPDAGLHVNSNAYVNTDFRVGTSIVMNDTAGQITAGSFVGDGSAMTGINSDSGSWVNGTGNVYLSTTTDKVGIGTSDPPCLLTIDGGIGVDSSGGVLCIKQKGDTVNDGITLTSSHSNSTRMYKDGDGHFNLHNTGGGSFLFENVTGNVGIGGRTVGLLAPLHVSIPGGLDYGGYTNTPLDMSKDMFRIGNRIVNNPTYNDNEYGIQFGVSGSGNSSIQTYVYNHSTTSTTASYSLLLQPNGGNVGIGTTSPEYNLDVTGNLRVTTGIVDTSWCSGSWLQTCSTSPTVTIYSNNGGGPMSSVSHGGTNMGGNRGLFTARKTGNYLISCCVIHAGRGGADATGSNLLIVFDANGNNWSANNVIATYDEIIDLRVAPSVEEAYTFMCQVYMEVGHYFSFRVHSSGYIDNNAKMLCSAALVR